jgi:type IV secretory pathway VirB10-like protein
MKASRPILAVGLALVHFSFSGCQGEPVRQAAPTPPAAEPALQTPAPTPAPTTKPAVVEPPPPTTAELAQQRMAPILAATSPGVERRAKLMEAARLALTSGTSGREIAVLIARQAVDESGAGAAEHLLYARCLFEVKTRLKNLSVWKRNCRPLLAALRIWPVA